MKQEIQRIVKNALKEDAVRNDITTNNFVPRSHVSRAYIIAKEPGIVCGTDLAREVFKQIDSKLQFKLRHKDGQRVKAGSKIVEIKGKARSILKGERVALNFLGYLSGISTLTQEYVKEVRGSRAKIYDTRKTTPTLRVLEKYAVRCGGGKNHRYDLSELIMIKDNHLAVFNGHRSLKDQIKLIRQKTKHKIELEVENLKQYKNALGAKPDIILLDNMKPAQLKKAANIKKIRKCKILLEASGGISLKNVKSISQTGVNRISIGALTHSAQSIDFSLELTD